MSFAQPFSNYEIIDRVGAGAMGTVFKARQKHLGRIVALKVLKPSLARDKRYVDRLRREARIVGRLNHPNIVTAYDLGEEGGYHFFVMEFVEGQSLRDLLTEWGMFPEEKVLDVALQISDALAHAFEIGVIHRDIKPANVLIDRKGKVKLTDMGLAKAKTDLTLTRDGATVGTPQYLSPEQARDPQAVDVRSDLYSLGATLFHMATGQPPFRADTIGELITKVLHDGPPSVTELNPELSGGLSLVIRKLLVKDRDRRYRSPQELLEDLARVRRHERPAVDLAALDTPGTPRREQPRLPVRRRPGWVLPVVGLVVGGLLGGGIAYGVAGDPAPAALGPQELAAAAKSLEADLQKLGSARQRLARLERAEVWASASDRPSESAADEEKAERAAQRAWGEIVEQLRRAELENLDAGLRDELDRFEELHGEVVETLLERPDELAPRSERAATAALRQRFGFGFDDLPTARSRDIARAGFTGLERRLEVLRQERAEAVDAAHAAWLRDRIGPELERALIAGQFDVVESRLDGPIAGLTSDAGTEEEPGGAPHLGAPGRLGAALRARLTSREEAFADEVRQQLARARRTAADRLRRSALPALASLERLADDLEGRRVDPWPLRRRVDRLEQQLRRGHPRPEAFRSVDSPWSEILPRLAVLRERALAAGDRFQQQAVDGAIDLAHRLFDDAGPAVAARSLAVWLPAGGRAAADPAERRLLRHYELFSSAAELVRAAVTASGDALPVGEDSVIGPDARLALVAAPGAADPGANGEPGREVRLLGRAAAGAGWRDVPWEPVLAASLAARAGDGDGEPVEASAASPWTGNRLARGAAMLLLTADKPAPARRCVDADGWLFLQAEVWPRLSAPPVAVEAGERAARLAIQELVRAFSAGDRDQLRSLLATFERDHARSDAARAAAGLRSRWVSWLEQTQQADLGVRDLAARAPEGFRVGRESDGALWCAGEVGRSAAVTIDGDWAAEGEALRHGADTDSFGAGLGLASPFPMATALEAEVEVRVPVRNREAALLWVDVHEAWVALAVLPSGIVVCAVPPAEVFPEEGEGLGQALLASIQAVTRQRIAEQGTERAPRVVDGAWHRLRIRVEPRRGDEVRVRAWLDDERGELCSRIVAQGEWASRTPEAELRVLTSVGFAVREVRIATVVR